MRTKLLTLTLLFPLVFLAACGKAKQPVQPPKPTAEQVQAVQAALEKSAAEGDKSAQFELGALYHDGENMKQDYAKAKEWFEKAAKQGEVRAQFNLGVMYYQGEGMKQDYAKAKEWFEKAANAGNPRSLFNLGVMYYQGEGMKQDFAKAMDLFSKAAYMNFIEAQFNLAVMYLKGEGISAPDFVKGYAWMKIVLDQGDQRAVDVEPLLKKQLTAEQLDAGTKLATELKKKIVKSAI